MIPARLTDAFAKILIVTFILVLSISCSPAPEEPVEPAKPSAEVPDELAFLPNPKVVPLEELTKEMIEQEAARSTAENALVVRYPRDEFDAIYGDAPPIEEQDWWQEIAEGRSVEEYLASEEMAGTPYLATVETEGAVYTAQLCLSLKPDSEACVQLPKPYGCVCFPTPPDPEDYPTGSDGVTIPSPSDTACDSRVLLVAGQPCRERTNCESVCRDLSVSPGISGRMCNCSDFPVTVANATADQESKQDCEHPDRS